jgi:hypothetical protein
VGTWYQPARKFRISNGNGKDGRSMFDDGAARHLRRHWAVFAGLALGLAIWCVVDVARRAIVDAERPHLHMTDFTVYTEAGAAFFDGREPYEVTNLRGWKYLYPPLFALLVAPLAQLNATAQVTVFFAISAVLCLGSYFESRRLLAAIVAQTPARPPVVALLSIVAGVTVLFPALNCLQRGQIGVVLLYPLLLGLRLILCGKERRSWFPGGLVLALPIVLKLTPLLPVGCLVLAFAIAAWRRRPRSTAPEELPTRTRSGPIWAGLGVLAGGILFVVLLPASLLGWQANLKHLCNWYERVATKADHDRTDQFAGAGSTIRNQSLTNAVQRFGNWTAFQFVGGPDDRLLDQVRLPELGTMPMDSPVVHATLLGVRGLAGIALLAAVIALGRRGDRVSLGFVLGLGCVATLVVSPVARGHYFLLYLPAVLFGGLWMCRQHGERAGLCFAGIPMFLCLVHYTALNVAGRIGVLGIGTALWFFAACATVLAGTARGAQYQWQDDVPPAVRVHECCHRAAA